MNPFAKILLDRLISYLIAHPELLDELIATIIDAIIREAKKAH